MKFGSAISSGALTVAVLVSASAIAAQPAQNGQQIFRQRCQSCHTASAAPGPLAPGLAGVVGRRAAGTSYANYSPALRASGIVWTRANLDRYLSGPTAMVRGTRMVVVMTDRAQRAAVISYLATLR